MKNKLLLSSSLLIAFLLIFSSCKKGEDDPFFSLRTRTTRLAGEWKINSMDYNIKTNSEGVTTDATYSYKNGKKNISYDDGTYSSFVFYDRYTFSKNGTYTRRIEYEGGSFVAIEGNWSWLKKNKDLDLKNKEAILLTITKLIENFNGEEEINNYSGNKNKLDEMLVFKRLSNDEIIIDYDYTHTDNNGYLYQKIGEATYESN